MATFFLRCSSALAASRLERRSRRAAILPLEPGASREEEFPA